MGQVTTLQREDLNISGLMSVPRGAGYMGVFGSGQYKCFLNSGAFVVPNGITELRVRVVGAGGAVIQRQTDGVEQGGLAGASGPADEEEGFVLEG